MFAQMVVLGMTSGNHINDTFWGWMSSQDHSGVKYTIEPH
jgi:hypothetical protein